MSSQESVRIGENEVDFSDESACLLVELDQGLSRSDSCKPGEKNIREEGVDIDIRTCNICRACVAIEYFDGHLVEVAPMDDSPSLNVCRRVTYEPLF